MDLAQVLLELLRPRRQMLTIVDVLGLQHHLGELVDHLSQSPHSADVVTATEHRAISEEKPTAPSDSVVPSD